MVDIHERYTKQLYARWRYFASWLPNSPVSLGDVGVVEGRRFRRLTSLDELGVPMTPGRPGERANYQYSSAGQVSVAVGGSGSAELGTDGPSATVSIHFKRAGATFFQAADGVEQSLTDLPGLEAQLRRRHEAGTWRREYVVVSTVVRTGPAAIFVSEERDGGVEFRVSGGLEVGPLSVAHAASALTVVRKARVAVAVVAPDGLTPLFQLGGLRARRGGDQTWNFMSEPTDPPTPATRDDAVPAVPEAPDAELSLRRLDWADFAQDR